MVANYAAGRGDSRRAVALERIEAVLDGGHGPRAAHHREALRAMIRPVLRMGDPLWQKSVPVEDFGTAELTSLLVDMRDTMAHLNGAGLAAPQIGVPLRVVIFGVSAIRAIRTSSRCPTRSSSTRC